MVIILLSSRKTNVLNIILTFKKSKICGIFIFKGRKDNISMNGKTRRTVLVHIDVTSKPEVSDETGALLVYSCFITYKSFSQGPTSIEHAELLGTSMRT